MNKIRGRPDFFNNNERMVKKQIQIDGKGMHMMKHIYANKTVKLLTTDTLFDASVCCNYQIKHCSIRSFTIMENMAMHWENSV